MKNINRRIITLLIVFILINSYSYGRGFDLPKPSYEFYVYDGANIIDGGLSNHIIETNKRLYSQIGTQVVVATVDTLNGIDKNSYATALFEEWKIGSKGEDNGLLILIAPNEGEIWIEVGYGLEGAFPDGITKRIIEDHMIPFFKEGNYKDGILSGYNQLMIRIEDEYDLDIEGIDIEDTPMMEESINLNPIIILLIVGIFIFLDSRLFGGRIMRGIFNILYIMGGSGRYRGGPPGGFGGGSSGGSSGGGGRSGGGGAGGSW